MITLMMCLVGISYGQDTIYTKNNEVIIAKEIVIKNVPTENPNNWVKGMYYTDVLGERKNIKEIDVLRISLKKLPTGENKEVAFISELKFNSSPRTKIYTKLKIWIADTWKSANDVIQVDNKEGGSVLLKGLSNIYVSNNGYQSKLKLWYTIEFKINDNYILGTVKNIYIETYASYSNGISFPEVQTSAESFNNNITFCEMTDSDLEKLCEKLDKKECTNTKKLARNKNVREYSANAIDNIESTISSILLSFEQSLKGIDSDMYEITSDEALTELKKCKDKLDLGLITQEDFDKKKAELSKFIK